MSRIAVALAAVLVSGLMMQASVSAAAEAEFIRIADSSPTNLTLECDETVAAKQAVMEMLIQGADDETIAEHKAAIEAYSKVARATDTCEELVVTNKALETLFMKMLEFPGTAADLWEVPIMKAYLQAALEAIRDEKKNK
ncbi:MAG: hypothetical protein AB7G93_19130 [Bdellovibrionales bacterium]